MPEDGLITVSLDFGGQRLNRCFHVDPRMIRDAIVHWRTQEAAEIGDIWAQRTVITAEHARHELTLHMGGMIAESLSLMLDRLAADKSRN